MPRGHSVDLIIIPQPNVTTPRIIIIPADMDGWTKARAHRGSAELIAGLCQKGGKRGHSLRQIMLKISIRAIWDDGTKPCLCVRMRRFQKRIGYRAPALFHTSGGRPTATRRSLVTRPARPCSASQRARMSVGSAMGACRAVHSCRPPRAKSAIRDLRTDPKTVLKDLSDAGLLFVRF